MQELKIIEQKQGTIVINYEELKQDLEVALKKYKNLVVTEEYKKEAEKDKALLNKAFNQLETQRKQLKNYILEPYTSVEKELKELSGMVKECSDNLKKQLDYFEEQEDKAKKEEIKIAFEKLCLIPEVKLNQIFNEKWLNKTYNMKKIEEEIIEKLEKISQELHTLELLDSVNFPLLKTTYLKDLDINKAMELEKDIRQVKPYESEKKLVASQKETILEELEEEITISFTITAKKQDILDLGEYFKAKNIKVLNQRKEI